MNREDEAGLYYYLQYLSVPQQVCSIVCSICQYLSRSVVSGGAGLTVDASGVLLTVNTDSASLANAVIV